jgi:steroid 5-alpha reductase family enzyme
MPLLALIGGVSIGLCLAMAGGWALARRSGNGGWADVVWSFTTGAAGVAYAVTPTAGFMPAPRAALVAILIAGWSLRLGFHLWRRTAGAAHEDARYAEFRREWGPAFQRRMFVFLQIQALASALPTLAMLAAARNPAPFPAWSDIAGIALLAAAVVGEGAADAQLAHYKADPANKGGVCDTGLWGWSRHPNYFFEWLGWLAYAVIAIGPMGERPLAWAALAGPAFMFALLRFVSGVPPTEAAMAKSRGVVFADYQARVSAFFPLPPRAANHPQNRSRETA